MITKGPIQGDKVEASVVGKVTDIWGNALPDASVSIAGKMLKTDAMGIFVLPNHLLDNSGTLIRVSREGFIDGARFVFPHLNGKSYIDIHLLESSYVDDFDADSKEETGFQGCRIEIPAGAIATANGSPYHGRVYIFAAWLDPTSALTFNTMPGDLRAIDAQGHAKILKTYGMMAIELISDTGEKLNLLAGKTAKLTFPVPSSMVSTAPAIIPLWHFNTTNGYWEESGTASLKNGKYEAEVSHFSFWNCDYPNNFVGIKMRIVNGDGTPLSNLQVAIESTGFGTGKDFTDNEGLVSGFIPSGESLKLNIMDRCGNIVYQRDIGPYYSDSDLGKIYIQNLNTITVSGVLTDCNGAPIPNGLATLAMVGDSVQVYTFTNDAGVFTFNFPKCGSPSIVKVAGYNLNNLTQSALQPVILSGATTNTGMISVCVPLDEFMTFTCNGFTQTFTLNPEFFSYGTNDGFLRVRGPNLLGGSAGDSTLIYFGFKDLASNQNSAMLDYFYTTCIEHNTVQSYGCNYCLDLGCNCQPMIVNPVVFYDYPNNVGEYAVGWISGSTYSNQDQTLKPFSVNFRVKRKQ